MAARPRANWKGYLKIGELTCAVALHTAASTSDRVSFHMVNRDTGNRLRREFVDSVTGKPVDRDDQVKGYETGSDEYVVFEPDEIAAVLPDGDKTIKVESFLKCADIDTVYLDRPYYLTPADATAAEAYALIRDAMRRKKVAALAEAVLFRRVRKLLVRPHGDGLIATMLNFDYEVRSAEDAFEDVPRIDIKGEMLDLAKHIIDSKTGKFDPSAFTDRYDDALAELVRAKAAGKEIKPRKPAAGGKVIDLMEALRKSAGAAKSGSAKSKPAKSRSAKGKAAGRSKPAAAPRRKAG